MAVVEDKLLRGKRTHAVAEQNVWLAGVLGLRDDSERNHVCDELMETAGPEIAKSAGRFCRQAMATMIVAVNRKLSGTNVSASSA